MLRMIVLYKVHCHMNQMMLHGRKIPKAELKNCKHLSQQTKQNAFLFSTRNTQFSILFPVFGNYFRSQDHRRDNRYRPYLRWLFQLVQIVTILTEPAQQVDDWCSCSLQNNPHCLLDLTGNLDLWYIK